MLEYLAVALLGVVAAAVLVGLAIVPRYFDRNTPEERPTDAGVSLEQYQALALVVDDLQTAVAHGIEHVERVEKRINATVRRARKELQENGLESPALEAEYAQLQLLHGNGSEAGPVPTVHEDMGEGEASSIPGVSREQLQKVRFS